MGPEHYQRMNIDRMKDRLQELEQNFEQLKVKLAYRNNLSKDGYEDIGHVEEIPNFMCQKWPNDYMFVKQLHSMYDTFIGDHGPPTRQQFTQDFSVLKLFNTQFFMLVALTIILIMNNNIFYKS